MHSLHQLPLNNSFSALPTDFFSLQQPQGIENPVLVSANPQAAQLIGLDRDQLSSQAFIDIFSGNAPLPGSAPLAMAYAGHQFGQYNPQLGDGRGLLLAQVQNPQHGHWDIHLKGAGQTPYSRFGDGRAVLRSSIREYLCSEAMAGLGIATTRALCVIGSDTQVLRETVESAATLVRLARSHIRFGHFEYFHYRNQPQRVRQLTDYVIALHFPESDAAGDRYGEFLQKVVESTAHLIAHWQAVGFSHGVLNTDNMSILGDSFDYGPFGFLDDYDPSYICNHSDSVGRYAFNRQPGIGLWNLNALAHSLSSLIAIDQIKAILASYEPLLINHYDALMRAKLGLQQPHDDDPELVAQLLALLQNTPNDYTIFFRQLGDFESASGSWADQFVDREGFNNWATRYQSRLEREHSNQQDRRQRMQQVNPKYILRSYLAQAAIDAAQQQDYKLVEQLLSVLQRPFDEHPEWQHFAQAPPDWGKKMRLSCSS